MPRYFIHVRVGSTLVHDTEGEDFVDLNAAKNAAGVTSRRLLLAALPMEEPAGRQIEITDELGLTVAEPLSFAPRQTRELSISRAPIVASVKS